MTMAGPSIQFLAPSLWFWVLLSVPALCLAFWTYFRILAPLSAPSRALLWTLRGLAFLIVLFAIWQPVVTYARRDTGKPNLAVLLDASSSSALPAGAGSTGTRADAIATAAQKLRGDLASKYRLSWYAFNEGIHAVRPDSLPDPSGATALGGAMDAAVQRAAGEPLSGLVVVSDGVSTSGSDPLRVASASAVPIFTVAVGPDRSPQDLEIRRVRTNATAFAGEPLPFRVGIQTNGLAGKTAHLRISEGGATRFESEVPLLGGQGVEQEIAATLKPSAPGLSLYEVEVTAPGDSVAENNRRLVAVSVQEKKTRVLTVSDALDWEFKFLKRALEADTTLGYSFLVSEKPGEWTASGERTSRTLPGSVAALRDYAAVIVLWTSRRGYPESFTDALAGFAREGGGVFLLGAPESGVPSGLDRILPASFGSQNAPPAGSRSRRTSGADPGEAGVTLTAEGMRHGAVLVRDDAGEAARLLAALPPVITGSPIAARGGGKTLLEFTGSAAGRPALVVGFHERGKTGWMPARSLWRWQLTAKGAGLPEGTYAQFFSGLVRWFAEPVQREPFQVQPTRFVYQAGEAVSFEGSVWDAAYKPIAGAQIRVAYRSVDAAAGDSSRAARSGGASADAPRGELQLSASGEPGYYDGVGPSLPPGAYSYEATWRDESGDRVLGRARGRFWVEAMGPEFSRSSADRQTLAEMARRSGGAAVELASLGDLAPRIPKALRSGGRTREVEVWNHWLLFLAFVTVLSTEWSLRRRRGLA